MLLYFKIFVKKNIQLQQKISTIHYFSHANSLLFTLHFITFYQPKSNELNCV